MPNFYCTRESVKARGFSGRLLDPTIDRAIEAGSRRIDTWSRRNFIPETATRLFPWPPRQSSRAHILWLDQDLISVSTLQTKAQDSSPTTISSSDFFLEPNNEGPPYDRVEIDLSGTAAFESGDTPQRSISIAGSWGYQAATKPVGLVDDASGITAGETTLIVKNSSRIAGIGVGNTLLIGSEQLFVVDKDFAALAPDGGSAILLDMAGDLAANPGTDLVIVDSSHTIVAGEVIRINTEQMYVLYVSTNALTVFRAFDGSTLAAHTNNDPIHIARTLTVERGVNGTTAASISDNDAISIYEPPFEIIEWAIQEAIATIHQESSGMGRSIGAGDGAREVTGRELSSMRERNIDNWERSREAAIG